MALPRGDRVWTDFLITWGRPRSSRPSSGCEIWSAPDSSDNSALRPASFAASAVVLALLSTVGAPSRAAAQFRVESRAVLVDVSVTRDGPVRGLQEEDFDLLVAGEPKEFRLLDPNTLPLAVLFAMDVSASTAGERRRRLAAGARQFAGALTERDDCAVVAFSNRAQWVREFASCSGDVGDGPAPDRRRRGHRPLGRCCPVARGPALGKRPSGVAALHGRSRQPELGAGTSHPDCGAGLGGAPLLHHRPGAAAFADPAHRSERGSNSWKTWSGSPAVDR